MESHSLTLFISWLSDAWLPIVVVIAAALVAEYVGAELIKVAIRRTVHGHHLGRSDPVSIDVKKRQNTVISLSLVLWKTIIAVCAGLALLKVIVPGFDVAPLLASAGVLGAVLGFGAQSIIKDVIAGISIITENQFRVGDHVKLEGNGVEASGSVEHITLRGTVLRDNKGQLHYMANGTFQHVVNKSMHSAIDKKESSRS